MGFNERYYLSKENPMDPVRLDTKNIVITATAVAIVVPLVRGAAYALTTKALKKLTPSQ
jgi:hypothetical protein